MRNWEVVVLIVVYCSFYNHKLFFHSAAADHVNHTIADERGFVNIDCGNEDAAYIDTGKSMKISPEYLSDAYDPIYKTVRSFPSRNRSCYTLKLSEGRNYNYLIRAQFLYGNYDWQNSMPRFDIYVGVDFAATVGIESPSKRVFVELLYKPTMDFISFCLIKTGEGTPFISALYLRPLKSSLYDYDLGALRTRRRYATSFLAPKNDLGFKSFADDTYDRFWSNVPTKFYTWWKPYNSSTELENLSNDAYQVPPSILKAGVVPQPGQRGLLFRFTTDDPPPYYFYWHFAETEKLRKNESREFDIFILGNRFRSVKPEYLKALTVVSPPVNLELGNSQLWFSINQTNTSTHPPILNAFEIFSVLNISQASTNQDDVKAISEIKTDYNTVITGWQGDPCLPVVPWDGLNCNNTNTDHPRITSLDLSSKGLTGGISPSLSGLTALNILNLSYNALTGSIPEFLAGMSSLQVIDLRGNKLNGSVPVKIAERITQGSLSLSLDGNPDLCQLDSCNVLMNKKNRHKVLLSTIAWIAASIFLLIIIAVAVFYAYKWKRNAGDVTNVKSKNQVFTYSEVVSMTSNFQKILGKGGSGMVYFGCLRDGTPVAVKILNQSSALTYKMFQTEAQLLIRVHHKNLVSLIGYCEEGTAKVLIYEYIANGSLQQHLLEETVEVLSWKKRLQIAVDTAQGLDYIHSGCKPSIIHRDMKTSNILLDDKLRAKISDFGISREFSTESHLSTGDSSGKHATHLSTDFAGTYGYVDPEYYGTFRLNEKSDVYGFGVVLLELITGQPAIVRSNGEAIHLIAMVNPLLESGDIYNIVDKKLDGNFSTNSVWKALEVVMACVASIGIQRPSMNQVLTDLKDCLAIEITHERGRELGTNENSLNQELSDNGIVIADTEAEMGPSAR